MLDPGVPDDPQVCTTFGLFPSDVYRILTLIVGYNALALLPFSPTFSPENQAVRVCCMLMAMHRIQSVHSSCALLAWERVMYLGITPL